MMLSKQRRWRTSLDVWHGKYTLSKTFVGGLASTLRQEINSISLRTQITFRLLTQEQQLRVQWQGLNSSPQHQRVSWFRDNCLHFCPNIVREGSRHHMETPRQVPANCSEDGHVSHNLLILSNYWQVVSGCRTDLFYYYLSFLRSDGGPLAQF